MAAFFAEPVMGAGGVIVPPESYFAKIQPVLKKYDMLIVADEVICGFGRTGNMWGSDTYGIAPDLITCAKQLSSAYLPIAGVLMSDRFYGVLADASDRLGTLGMGYTYGGHPVAAAVAVETLKIYEDDDILGHVREVMPRFQQRLKALGAPAAGRRGARRRADRRRRDREGQGAPASSSTRSSRSTPRSPPSAWPTASSSAPSPATWSASARP